MKLNAKSMLLVFAGGALGSILRYFAGAVLINNFVALAVVNLLGAAFLGWFNGSAKAGKPKFTAAGSGQFWSVGFAGGFTTMSGLAMSYLFLSVDIPAALGYVLAQLAFGILVYIGAMKFSSGARRGA